VLPHKDRVKHHQVGLLVDPHIAGEEALIAVSVAGLAGLQAGGGWRAAGGQEAAGLAAGGGYFKFTASCSQLSCILISGAVYA
jgi:hypothetical protein